jgi:hypothetical protein
MTKRVRRPCERSEAIQKTDNEAEQIHVIVRYEAIRKDRNPEKSARSGEVLPRPSDPAGSTCVIIDCARVSFIHSP